ncbi:hypothetical protein N656DRAFT_322954 [Canariomyces notabilis]|uniref:Uncharacterized protein n=1 Tax=Canariomyces notabilis TaxID=2074819 RepID=A0AAN6QHN9_9PEZI|nr:hypothetical protein N656DRAFT_322954 [Canariomyces arenarius]
MTLRFLHVLALRTRPNMPGRLCPASAKCVVRHTSVRAKEEVGRCRRYFTDGLKSIGIHQGVLESHVVQCKISAITVLFCAGCIVCTYIQYTYTLRLSRYNLCDRAPRGTVPGQRLNKGACLWMYNSNLGRKRISSDSLPFYFLA